MSQKTEPKKPDGNRLICKVCRIQSSLRCKNCRKVAYCSVAHQKDDWRSHKGDCFPGGMATCPIMGRYLIATRDIFEGSLVLKENPLFSAPNGKNISFPLCLGCFGIVFSSDGVKTQLCSNCGWPLHKACANNKTHLENECKIFRGLGLSPHSPEENMYTKILVLRGCLLKLNNLKKWEYVKELQNHQEERLKTRDGLKDSKHMIDFIRIKCELGSDFTDSEVDHIYGSVVVNGYLAEDDVTNSHDFHAGCFVYFMASMPAHHCAPNCKWTILKGGELRLWALKDIKEGESLSHSYVWGGQGTLERQAHLLASKFFICACSRCQDPTEGGSFFSGFKCSDNSCSGLVVSKNPLTLGSEWECSRCGGSQMTEPQVLKLIKQLRASHSSVTKSCQSGQEMGGEGWRKVFQMLEETKKSVFLSRVSPTHFLVLEIDQDILTNISYILSQPDIVQESKDWATISREEKLELAMTLVTLSRKWINILEKISPGLTTHKGRQLYYLQQGLGICIQNRIERQGAAESIQLLSTGVIMETSLQQAIHEWQDIRRKCLRILETESPGREDWIMGQAMKIGN